MASIRDQLFAATMSSSPATTATSAVGDGTKEKEKDLLAQFKSSLRSASSTPLASAAPPQPKKKKSLLSQFRTPSSSSPTSKVTSRPPDLSCLDQFPSLK